MKATDDSAIEAIAGGLAVGVGVGLQLIGLGASLGVAAANNNIANTVLAYVDDSTVTSAGKVNLGAAEQSSILTVTVGGAVAVGVGTGELVGVGIALAVAGSDSSSTIANTVHASVSDQSNVIAQKGSVAIDATDTSTITAGGGGLAAALSVGGGLVAGAVSFAAGFAVATNDIGNSVKAYVDDSTVTAMGGSVTLSASEKATSTAVTVGGAVSIAVGAGIGLAAAVAVGVGYSSNTVDNTVEAYLANGASVTTTNSGDVSLTATDSPDLTAVTVAASVGLSASVVGATFTLSAAIANNDVHDTVEAYSDSSSINSAGQIQLKAEMPTSAKIQSTTVAASVAITAAIGGAFAGAGADSTNTVDNTIKSDIQGASANGINATGDITLTADETAQISSQIVSAAVAAAVVGASVGLSLAENTVNSSITAYVDNATVESTGGNGEISIGASSSDTINTLSVAASVAAAIGAAAAGAFADADVSPSVTAYAGTGATLNAAGGGASPNAGDIFITASSSNNATAATYGIAAGFVAVGGSITTASANGLTSAYLDGTVTGSDNLTIGATANNDSSDAEATALAGGIIAGSGAAAIATTSPTVQAAINDNSSITATGAVLINANNQSPQATATTLGVDFGGVSIGVNVSIATVNGMTSSYLGNPTQLSAASLSVEATRNDATEHSLATAGAGGILAAVNATVSTASSGGTVQATIGSASLGNAPANSNTPAPGIGNVTIEANSTSNQSATATGVAIGGILAIGLDNADASSDVNTVAQLGAGTNAYIPGALQVTATGSDTNNAYSTAGSGGLIAGDASVGTTEDNSTVESELGASGDETPSTILAGSVLVNAVNNGSFTPSVNSTNAGLAGASGASESNSDTTSANSAVWDQTTIVAVTQVQISALNNFTENGGTVSGKAGGLANVAAARSDTTINGTPAINGTSAGTAGVTIGNDVKITVMNPSASPSSATNPSGIFLSAASTLTTADNVTLTGGGGIEIGATDFETERHADQQRFGRLERYAPHE